METKPIVVGTDGSDHSMNAVAWAARAAGRRGAPLRIVSVASVQPAAVWARPLPEPTGPLEHAAAEHALSRAVAKASDLAPDVLIDADLMAGLPAPTLVTTASGAAMLVVGSRGAGGFITMLLGSISRYVATHAPVPVVVVRQENTVVHDRIAVGVRDPESASAALAFAFREAALRQARLLAVHAWFHSALRHTGYYVPGSASPDEVSEKAAAELSHMLDRCREQHPGVDAGLEVVNAHPGQVLTDLSARADLVVLGRRAGTTEPPRVGAVTHAVLNHAHGPVAFVPPTS